jgi:TusA-related sulfurtransferase
MAPGETLELTLDDPRGARDIPRAAEAEGYAMVETRAAAGVWILRIEK